MPYTEIGPMNLETFKEDVEKWVIDWVSQHNGKLGHVPCPFAKQAVIQKKIDYVWCQKIDDVRITLYGCMDQGLNNDVLAIGIAPNTITADELSELVKYANEKWLMRCGLVALEDHPYDPEIIAGERMNQGKWALILIQAIAKLNAASDILAKQGYYDLWTQQQLDDVVTWRKDIAKSND